MGKIKGWRKTSNTKKNIKWKNSNDTKTVFVVYDKNVPFGRNDGTYYFIAKDNKNILSSKNGLTKQEALEYAINYMRANPNG